LINVFKRVGKRAVSVVFLSFLSFLPSVQLQRKSFIFSKLVSHGLYYIEIIFPGLFSDSLLIAVLVKGGKSKLQIIMEPFFSKSEVYCWRYGHWKSQFHAREKIGFFGPKAEALLHQSIFFSILTLP
jgi:hypothetical protein